MLHEGVHSFLSVSDGAPLAGIRQAFGQWAYDSSQLLRFTEEAIAEGVATGSVTGGSAFPFANGYVTVSGVLGEAGAFGLGVVGVIYVGNWLLWR